jgi:LPS-assembly lipoprotein
MRVRWSVRLLPALALPPVLALLLAGCGFHLQGSNSLPRSLAVARIAAVDEQSDFCHGLRAALLAAGTRLDADAADAANAGNTPTISILEDSTSERVLTVSVRNIPTAYQLSYRVRISVARPGQELMPPEEHTLTREFSFDERALLAKEREREVLAQALADDLVALVMRRLASL